MCTHVCQAEAADSSDKNVVDNYTQKSQTLGACWRPSLCLAVLIFKNRRFYSL